MADKVQPITPSEVIRGKRASIPDVVFEVFNELIAKKFDGISAVIGEDEVVQMLVKKGLKEGEIYGNHWLDVEDNYRSAGWKVEYDKPGFNEEHEATFEFSSPQKKA